VVERRVLDGYRLTAKSTEALEKAHGMKVSSSEVGRFVYSGEQRLVINRNVRETQEDMAVGVIRMSVDYSRLILLTALWLSSGAIAFAVLNGLPMYTFISIWATLSVWPLGWRAWKMVRDPKKTILYVPHAVSCACAEYDNGATMEVVLANVRQKLLRLATLPIPDYQADALMDGTEEVIKVAVQCRHFFDSEPRLALARL
jgi:hypothetical protein